MDGRQRLLLYTSLGFEEAWFDRKALTMYIMREGERGQRYIIFREDSGDEKIVAWSSALDPQGRFMKRLPYFCINMSQKTLKHFKRVNKHMSSEEIEQLLFIELLD